MDWFDFFVIFLIGMVAGIFLIIAFSAGTNMWPVDMEEYETLQGQVACFKEDLELFDVQGDNALCVSKDFDAFIVKEIERKDGR